MTARRATGWGLLLVIAALVAWYASRGKVYSPDAFTSLDVGAPAPDFHVPLLAPGPAAPIDLRSWQAGRAVSLQEHRGVPVVLDFWGTWCDPCVERRPTLTALAQRYADRGVVLYGISYRESPQKALKWLQKHGGATYPELQDDGGRVASAYLVHGVPQMYVIGSDGRLRWHCFGCDSLPKYLYPVLDSALSESTPRIESHATAPPH